MKKFIITITLLITLVSSIFAASDKVIIVNNSDRAVKVKATVTDTAFRDYDGDGFYERGSTTITDIVESLPHSEIELSAFEDMEYFFEGKGEHSTIQFSEKGWYILRRYEKHDDAYIVIWYSDGDDEVWYYAN